MNLEIHKHDDPAPERALGEHYRNIPFEVIPVAALALPEVRLTLAQWWTPPYETKLASLLKFVLPKGCARIFKRPLSLIKIKYTIELTYPLQHRWTATVEHDAREIGGLFVAAYDLYKHIYDLDDQAWLAQGHSAVPRLAPGMANRGRGEYVWGHDMGDLVFEGVTYYPKEGLVPFEPKTTYDEPTDLGIFTFAIGS